MLVFLLHLAAIVLAFASAFVPAVRRVALFPLAFGCFLLAFFIQTGVFDWVRY